MDAVSNLTWGEAYDAVRNYALGTLFLEIQSAADDGADIYPVELIVIYDDVTVVAFDDARNMVKFVLHGEDDMDGSGNRRYYSWVERYLLSPSGSWIKFREPNV